MPAVVQIGSRTRRSEEAIRRSVLAAAPRASDPKPSMASPAAPIANSRRVIPSAIPFLQSFEIVRKADDDSRLLDVPHEQGWSDDDALQVLSICGHRRPLPGRDIGQRFESARLDLYGDLLPGFAVGRLQPLRTQCFEVLVLGP